MGHSGFVAYHDRATCRPVGVVKIAGHRLEAGPGHALDGANPSFGVVEILVVAVVDHVARLVIGEGAKVWRRVDLVGECYVFYRVSPGFRYLTRRIEVRGLPLIHDKTVNEWGTGVLG